MSVLPKKQQSSPAFTIVELLIVIVVIGILAAITIVAYNGIQDRAHASSAQAASHNLASLLGVANTTNGTYPSDLSTINNGGPMPTTDGTTYAYHPGTGNTSYCATVTNGKSSYKITDTAPKPVSGGCPGDGVGGVAAITNLVVNPSFESNLNDWVSSGTNTRDTSTFTNGGASAKITTPTVTPGYLYKDITASPGQIYTLSTDVKTVGTNGSSWAVVIQAFTSASGYLTAYSTSIPATQASFIRLSVTTAALPANTGFIRVFPAWNSNNGVAGDGLYVDSVMVTQGSTQYTYADGNSPNWIWNGTPNNSTSTGPPQ